MVFEINRVEFSLFFFLLFSFLSFFLLLFVFRMCVCLCVCVCVCFSLVLSLQLLRMASTADITSGLQLGRVEVLRGLRNFLSTDKPEHHSIDRLKERGVEKGSGRHSTLKD